MSRGEDLDEGELYRRSFPFVEVVSLRPELKAFAEAMELRLRENDHKSGWDEMGVNSAIRRCYDELRELDHAALIGSSFDQMHEAEDLANFAFFAWWNARLNREEPPEPSTVDFDHDKEDED